jgi:hypothetical protein
MRKKGITDDGFIPLSKAIKAVSKSHPWLPNRALRDVVREGLIPMRRSSLSPNARYFVRLTDVYEYIEELAKLRK